MTEVAFLSRFTPSLLSPETLEAIFVQREPLAQRLVERIRESALTDNKHYALLIGPRGIGKTHLVSLVYHRVRKDPELEDKLAFAWLKEEEWGIASYLDFLRCLLQALGVESLDIELEKKVDELYDIEPEGAVRQAEQLLLTAIGDRTLLLIAENLDQIFHSLGRAGQEQLRALIQNQPRFTILATSQSLFNGVSTRNSPFFGFFTHHHLDALSFEDAVAMVTKIAEHEGHNDLIEFIQTPRGRARIRAAHHLAAGNHRVYVIFSQFLTRDSLDELVQPLLQTIDDLTPYYQARMVYLSAQQRRIVFYLSERRHPVTVGEIAQKNSLSPQTVSSQLKKLRELGYVRAGRSGRESYYELSEPLMRLALEIKKLRGEPIRLFVDFLRIWYSNEELSLRLGYFNSDSSAEYNYLMKALAANVDASADSVLTACWRSFWEAHDSDRFTKALVVAEELTEVSDDPSGWLARASCLYFVGQKSEAVRALEKARRQDNLSADQWYVLGHYLFLLDCNQSGLMAINHAIALSSRPCPAYLALRGLILRRLGYLSESLKLIELASRQEPEDSYFLVYRAAALESLGRCEEALSFMERALEVQEHPPSFHRLSNLAMLLIQHGHATEGEAKLVEAIERLKVQGADEVEIAIVRNLLMRTRDRAQWCEHIKRWIAFFKQHDALAYLGEGLVQSIRTIVAIDWLTVDVAEAWNAVWQELGAGYPDLELPLRLLDAAVHYLRKPSERVLLSLAAEERPILIDLLGLDLEEESDAIANVA